MTPSPSPTTIDPTSYLSTPGSSSRVAVEDHDGALTYGELAADALGLRARVPEGAVVELRAHRARTVVAAMSALDGWVHRVDLLGDLDLADTESEAVTLDDSVLETTADVASTSPPEPGSRTTRWRLFTSGTTGQPKPVDHTLRSLSRTARRPEDSENPDRPQQRWGLLYAPTRMAGTQVLLQALAGQDLLLDATGIDGLGNRLRWLGDRGMTALSATPTIWRQVLQSGQAGSLEPRQVTLGGEIADQQILDALARSFPTARITHIFASTETGAAFAVGDRREGFPRSYLTHPPRGIGLDVRDGILHVHAPEVPLAGPDGYVSTGDLVEVTDDRVRFLGRASGVVNVGGVTVSPEQVETVLRTQPDVVDAVVRARPNPFSGWILTAEVVVRGGVAAPGLPKELRALVGRQLSSAHVPAKIEVVSELTTSVTGKAGRR